MSQERFDIATTPQHVKYEHVLVFDTVDDDVLTDGKTSETSTQVFIATAS